MTNFEKVLFKSIITQQTLAGVYFEVEDNPLMEDFNEKLRTCDIVLMCRSVAQRMFEKRSLMEKFARERGFTTRYDLSQYMFVFEKEMPWHE